MNASQFLTPKDLADAIGGSESSVRRWVDSGDIQLSRTAGGHRRIPLAEAIRFIRARALPVVRPDVLGLELGEHMSAPAEDTPVPASPAERLFRLLHTGDASGSAALILAWFLEGQSLPAIFDGPIRDALTRMGELWKHDARGILIEHRATEICIRAVVQLRALLPMPIPSSPLAMGGSPQNDPYLLPTMMAGCVLAEAGFRELNFGADTPVELLGSEAIERQARLVWVSISTAQPAAPLRSAIRDLATTLAKQKIDLIIGGRSHAPFVPRDLPGITAVGSMSELAAYARGILSATSDAAN